MNITRNHKKSELFLSQSIYLKKVVDQFRMQNGKTVNSILDHHTKLWVIQNSPTREYKNKMESIPYAVSISNVWPAGYIKSLQTTNSFRKNVRMFLFIDNINISLHIFHVFTNIIMPPLM